MPPLRVSAIRYINSLPLIYGLRNNPHVRLTYDAPSVCFLKLVNQEADIALVPVITTQTTRMIHAVKGLGIAATRRTESVYLFANKPLDHIRTVLTDPASLSSVMLLKIILKDKYQNQPQFVKEPIVNVHDALRRYDAVLIIGDEAIMTEKSDYDHYDLATEWYSVTGFPFVFAVWATNRPLDNWEVELLHNSLFEGTRNWDQIYEMAEQMLPVDRQFLKRYYNENLHYQLTRSDYEGLLRFLSLAADLHFIDKVRKDIWL